MRVQSTAPVIKVKEKDMKSLLTGTSIVRSYVLQSGIVWLYSSKRTVLQNSKKINLS